MSVTVTFTDLEAAILQRLMSTVVDIQDVDFEILNAISGKVDRKCLKRELQLSKALAFYETKFVSKMCTKTKK